MKVITQYLIRLWWQEGTLSREKYDFWVLGAIVPRWSKTGFTYSNPQSKRHNFFRLYSSQCKASELIEQVLKSQLVSAHWYPHIGIRTLVYLVICISCKTVNFHLFRFTTDLKWIIIVRFAFAYENAVFNKTTKNVPKVMTFL